MSEKYTIKERSKNGQHGRTQLFEGSKQKFIGSFEEYDKAKEIMDILNEDEKRKSAPRIDKKFKEWANNELKLTIAHRSMYIDKEQWDENIRNLERLLNIVNSLEIQQ